MRIPRDRQTQGALQGQLPPRALEKVSAAYDVGDALSGIVHDDRKLIGEYSVAAPDDDVPELAHREGDRSLETVVEGYGLPLVDPEAQRRIAGPPRSLTAGAPVAAVVRREVARGEDALARMEAGAPRLPGVGIQPG